MSYCHSGSTQACDCKMSTNPDTLNKFKRFYKMIKSMYQGVSHSALSKIENIKYFFLVHLQFLPHKKRVFLLQNTNINLHQGMDTLFLKSSKYKNVCTTWRRLKVVLNKMVTRQKLTSCLTCKGGTQTTVNCTIGFIVSKCWKLVFTQKHLTVKTF